jgi:predicted Na+-dependent transporter
VFGTGAIAAGVVLTALAGLAGWLLSGPNIATRKVMVLGTGFRNLAAALLVGEEDFKDPRVIVMLVVVALAGVFLLLPIALAWAKTPVVRPAVTN